MVDDEERQELINSPEFKAMLEKRKLEQKAKESTKQPPSPLPPQPVDVEELPSELGRGKLPKKEKPSVFNSIPEATPSGEQKVTSTDRVEQRDRKADSANRSVPRLTDEAKALIEDHVSKIGGKTQKGYKQFLAPLLISVIVAYALFMFLPNPNYINKTDDTKNLSGIASDINTLKTNLAADELKMTQMQNTINILQSQLNTLK